MWFNHALIFQYRFPTAIQLEEALSAHALKPCPPHARFSLGWLPCFNEQWVHDIAGSQLFCMAKEERILPKTVINRLLNERILSIEVEQGRQVKRTERAQMAEDIEFELLPKAFCIQKKMYALFDTVNQHLIINSSSLTQASQLIALLRKACPEIEIEPLTQIDGLAQAFSSWITNPSHLPHGLQLGADCKLFSADDEKKRVHCKGYELPAEEVLSLIQQGLSVSELALIWNERVEFVLSQDFTLKRLKCTDILIDAFAEARNIEDEIQEQDASLSIFAGEMRALIQDLLKCAQQNASKATPVPLKAEALTV